MAKSKPFLPRIYYLDPELAGPASELEGQLERCAAMGFDHVMVASPASDEAAATLARTCAQKRLRLLLDLDLGSIGADATLLERHGDWFVGAGADDELPDPRRAPRRIATRAVRYERQDVLDQVAGYWRERLQPLIAAGVAGFRCINIAQQPPALWKGLIEAVRRMQDAACFLAWTPGCTPAQIDALAGCGFDATFSSGAWWDFRSRWLADEQFRLARVAPPIAFPDSPDGPVIARLTGNEDVAVRRQIYLRALGLAGAAGNGLLVPMGFEYGASGLAAGLYGTRPDWNAVRRDAPFDLSGDIAQANAFIASLGAAFYGRAPRLLSGADAGAAILLREASRNTAPGGSDKALLIITNADAMRSCMVNESQLLERADGFIRYEQLWPKDAGHVEEQAQDMPLELPAGGFRMFIAQRLAPILCPPVPGEAAAAAAKCPRIAIEAVAPTADGGKFPVKRIVGESVSIEADVFIDGHDKLAVIALWRAADEADWHEIRMHATGNDRWAASLPLTRIGRYLFAVEAWRDVFSTYRDELEKKTTAGLNVTVELEEGRLLVEAAARHAQDKGLVEVAQALAAMASSLQAAAPTGNSRAGPEGARDAERVAVLLSEPMAEAMRLADARPFAVRSETMRIDAERTAARYSSWYELFPRSQSGDPARHGTFADVEKRLPAIQAMGFDTLYFPPIHPIGRKHRKGRNNSLSAAPDDPGSPYAIGSDEGGHDALHPQLGTLDDFRHLRDEAARHGLELALDFAIQCSPDHPWLKAHPEWFAWRPDGTIRYAENPPKKYQDIVNVDFYADGAIPGLWIALRDAVQFWAQEGVRVFRVDNPHTKTLPFWEWMIADIRGRYPDTIFLSEAFTRPKMMYRLAKIGFSQSYTYFTWRHGKQEFIDYVTELTTTPVREYFRPHFFVNTPDINPYFLQRSGRPGFLIRAALATTLSGLWGMYSGFELCEGTPIPGKEEYLDSEKYEIRAWDWNRPGNIIGEITQLNRIRAENPALQTHLNIRFLHASDDNILFFIKATPPADSCQHKGSYSGDNVVLVAINLDPFAAHDTMLELPLWEFGMADDGTLDVDDLVNGTHLAWHGKHQQLRLDPFICPYAIWRIRHK
ncbi:alpha-1,4-glucan--maltose-1-phosphate maltosyltransferase [Noviherbaspirillum autotrophicum]|uniref:Alpha-1,4-glucan:maltose-1-phosphate maltosyltransferase n=1 Tax=Noviherbaspirillum autotrophicum TaxID=709839 RepID=A0A0C2BI32_9BURK|nr:alpha-1,4-glucan--maltose-1-phosphate maltosyltransferase [Noviherbaspirillum autotrophicum]KIF80870.1 alpha-amylase [Noviherbaspirillum autotrophicum]